jgi:hypothetical protein
LLLFSSKTRACKRERGGHNISSRHSKVFHRVLYRAFTMLVPPSLFPGDCYVFGQRREDERFRRLARRFTTPTLRRGLLHSRKSPAQRNPDYLLKGGAA